MARIKNLFGKDQTCILCVWCLFFVEGIFFFGTKITHMSLLLLLSTTTAAITQLCFLLSASNLQLRLIVTVTCWPLK